MPELLIELFGEEIPARMQEKAADDLRRLVTDRLVALSVCSVNAPPLTVDGVDVFVIEPILDNSV